MFHLTIGQTFRLAFPALTLWVPQSWPTLLSSAHCSVRESFILHTKSHYGPHSAYWCNHINAWRDRPRDESWAEERSALFRRLLFVDKKLQMSKHHLHFGSAVAWCSKPDNNAEKCSIRTGLSFAFTQHVLKPNECKHTRGKTMLQATYWQDINESMVNAVVLSFGAASLNQQFKTR